MPLIARLGTLLVLTLTLTLPLGAQTRAGVMGDLLHDIDQVQNKIVGLAKAMPEATYEWRPSEGVRSTAETFKHVAADNYFLPAILGAAPPADSGITKEYESTLAFEKKAMTRDQVIAELEKSFAFLKESMTGFPDAKLTGPIEVFGQKMTNQRLWILTTTHLHEHLGQLIAYARSNKVTPPWSKQEAD
jgi:uncharacterized damage-inducible protein DinB